MKKLNTNNIVILEGRISQLHEYAAGKAMKVNIAMDAEESDNKNTLYLQTQCFMPKIFANLTIGLLVRMYCHLSPNKRTKDGVVLYEPDVIVDYIDYEESKALVEARAAAMK